MAKVKWTEDLVIEVVRKCREAGTMAATRKLVELVQAGPKYAVYNSDLSGKQGECVGTLLDVCGFANLRIPARGKFFQLAKKMSKEDYDLRFFCTNAYHGGGHLSVFDTSMRQEMSVNTAACQAMVPILSEYGISASVESRID